MYWFRHRQPRFIRLAIVLWVLAFGLAATQGCLALPEHNPATPHVSLDTVSDGDSHDAHTLGCLQHCADTAITLSLSSHLQAFDLFSWTLLLLIPALLMRSPATLSAFPFLVLRRLAPARPPARLIFVRLND
ncbi:hypothetical protein [Pseudomonas sp. MWU13-2100]|uniref:hypothetical protein n=1 Tax=Pseudomonas sp. MWU13-2100 TaxID=2935075 RepID=UPI00200DCAF0|nr:hypothetical protein [Pseudomonas sp. MWU13-2100]